MHKFNVSIKLTISNFSAKAKHIKMEKNAKYKIAEELNEYNVLTASQTVQ